jgi:hypothetical protein
MPAKIEVQQLRDAKFAALNSRARTEPSQGLVHDLFQQICGAERKGRGPYKRTERQRRLAVEGLVGDLLRAQGNGKAGGWVYRSLGRKSFTGEDVGFRAFKGVIDRLQALDLVERAPGVSHFTKGFGPQDRLVRRYASRWRATPALLTLCETHGLRGENVKHHFVTELPKKPLRLRTSATRDEYGQKQPGKNKPFTPTKKTEQLEKEVRDLNTFFDQFTLRGGDHRGFVRIFNQGDDPDFAWDKGGRLYSHGEGNYQQMREADRINMTIDGEPVCEIDIRASYLTIFHGWFGEQLDPDKDPYLLPGLGKRAREVVKAWFLVAFGQDGFPKRWPPEVSKKYRERTGRSLSEYKVRTIAEKAVKAYPLLKRWGERKSGWASLMFTESRAIVGAMLDLMREQSVPSLSMHDGLIVPISKQNVAETVLGTRFRAAAGVEPILTVDRPQGH